MPEVAIVTSISLDHVKQLGDSLEGIARHKAGIFKQGRPAVSGVSDPAVSAIIAEVAHERQAPLRQLNRDFRYRYESARIRESGAAAVTERRASVQVSTWQREWPWMDLHLMGEHQAANASVVLATIDALRERGWQIDEAAVANGLGAVRWPSRVEVVGRAPWMVLDCAHNAASAHALVATLAEVLPPTRRILVFGCSNDKEIPAILRILAPHFAHACFTRYANPPRAVPPDQLAHWWKENGGGDCSCHGVASEAVAEARKLAHASDLICITGSVFLAGELRPLLVDAELRHPST